MTPSSLQLEELVHRQLAARVGQADDDAIDAARAHDGRNVVDGADDAGIQTGGADARRIGIDEPDDLDAELMAPLEQLARQIDSRLALVPTSSSRSRGADVAAGPLERDAPADDQRDDERATRS